MNQVERATDDRVRNKGVVMQILCCIALSTSLTWILTACDSSPTSKTATAQEISDGNALAISGLGEEIPAGQPVPAPADGAIEANAVPTATEAEDRPVETTAGGQEQNPVVADAAAAESGEGDAADTPELPVGIELLGTTVPPGTSQRLMWSASQIFEGVSTEAPVLIVNGRRDGPTLCLTAAIHGDELNGIEMVRQVMHDLDPDKLKGAVIGIPIVNLQGFRRGSRYLPDRRDLNRYFPGNPSGSSAARIAHSLFEKIIRHCNALVDLHTGSFYRTNLPQLRADLRHTKIKELTQGFGGIVVLHSVAAPGTLRRAATDAGIPAITLEAGEPLRLQTAKVSQGVTGIFKLLDTLDIISRIQLLAPPEPVFLPINLGTCKSWRYSFQRRAPGTRDRNRRCSGDCHRSDHQRTKSYLLSRKRPHSGHGFKPGRHAGICRISHRDRNRRSAHGYRRRFPGVERRRQ